ncbi:glycosyltransferase family 4 protein [Escherichia coli]
MSQLKKLHIVLVGNTLWSVYNFRRGLIQSFMSNGHRVTIVGPKDEFTEKLEGLGCDVVDIPISSQGKNPFIDMLLINRLRVVYKRIKPDFVFHYTIKPNIYGSIAAGLSRTKSIAITTGLGYVFNNSSFFTHIISHLYCFAFKFAKEVWFLNEDDRNVFIQRGIISPGKTHILDGEGVDTSFFIPRAKPISHKKSKVTFLLVARMLWDKGVGIYVDAARKLKEQYPDTEFQLLGACDVDNPSAIPRDIIDNWHEEGVVNYLGMTNDVRTVVSQADCIVLPSYYREGVSRTLMEAASMGKPVLTTDNVGCRNVVIEAQTGFLCKTKDVDSLVDAMNKILHLTPEERSEMGLNGRDYMISRFDERVIIADYYNAIQKYVEV